MRRLMLSVAGTLAALAILAAPAGAEFGLTEVGFDFKDEGGVAARQAGSHPFAVETLLMMNTLVEGSKEAPDGQVEDLLIALPEGFVGAPRAMSRCPSADFLEFEDLTHTACPDSTVLGYQALSYTVEPVPVGAEEFLHVPIYNLEPPPGVAARLGFIATQVPVTIDVLLNPDPPYNVEAEVTNIAQAALFIGSLTTLWGDPGAPAHDPLRGDCLSEGSSPLLEPISLGGCPLAPGQRQAFLTVPRSCEGPLETSFFARAWNTGEEDSALALTEPAMVGCEKLGFGPRIDAQPTSDHASSPSGLDFNLQIEDPGISNPAGLALSDVKKAVVTLPEGVTINPSQAEGLAVCSEAQLARETAISEFGAGCPAASKIGSVEVESPLLEGEIFKGSLFVAEPYENRFGSLLALYMTVKHPGVGLGVRLAGKVEPDPETGQLVTTFGTAGDELPQLPFSDFRLHFREGGRSPLVTPERCGTYETKALFTPWANPDSPFATTASFQITEGVGGGPCPPAGTRPFEPGFSAGTQNNNAGSYSPFHLRLQRRDGDQDLVRFDAKLPPGAVAKLAGVSKCPDAAIAALKVKTGIQELASPSCPANSKIGTVQAGAGVGSQLTYVKGAVYLAGPFAGAPLSVVGVVPAVAGPFDVGVVFTRQALSLDPITGQPEVDGSRSEPIPHILAGIPLKVRDIQVNVDRPDFTLNPTSCDELAVTASIWGGGANPFSLLDDSPVSRSERFQAANCANLGFRPRLSLKLKGGTKRGGHPALKAVLRPRPGDANLKRTVVKLPRSAFLDQAHIRTICTRVQFAQDACPPGSIYGHVKAFTPLLEEPLTGPAYLRSSDNKLPDLVFALKGIVEIEASARIDSVGGGIRATFAQVPDAPVFKVIVEMQGAKKGLIVNSRDLCAKPSRAEVRLGAHNGKRHKARPLLRASCPKSRKR